VQKVGDDAVDGGSFGDIWRGRVGEHEVAIKMMRVFGAKNINKLYKVFSMLYPI
jgi:hypothetical protein